MGVCGSADTVIRPHSSEQMVAELERAGGAARLTVFDGAEHVSVPGLVWRDDDLHLADWLSGRRDDLRGDGDAGATIISDIMFRRSDMKVLRKPLCILLAALSACIPAFAALRRTRPGTTG